MVEHTTRLACAYPVDRCAALTHLKLLTQVNLNNEVCVRQLSTTLTVRQWTHRLDYLNQRMINFELDRSVASNLQMLHADASARYSNT
eukprot:2237015-Amphidinium_carterae.1